MENEKIPQERKSTYLRVAFYTFFSVMITASILVSIVFGLLHDKQTPEFCWAHGSLNGFSMHESSYIISWNWTLYHCNGYVEEDNNQFITIKQSGNYFIYAQIYRIEKMNDTFTLILYKEPNIVLNEIVGPREGDPSSTVNFARLFFLYKGDRLYCRRNFDLDKVLIGNLSYWGLFKM